MPISPWPELSKAIADRREAAVELIQELVRRPSVDNESECQQLVAQYLRRRGLEVDVWEPDIEALRTHRAFVPVDYHYTGRPNVVGVLKGAGDGCSLALNGHTDVVPVDPRTTWEHDPWGGELVQGKVYGRGAADMKGGVAAGLIVVDALVDVGIELRGDLQFQSVVDEEGGGNGTLAAILRGYRADSTIFLEPTSTRLLLISSRGAQFFRIHVPGKEGGIEYKWELPNAIEKAMLVYQAVDRYAREREDLADDPLYVMHPTKIPVAVCQITAGAWPSTIPGECVMQGSLECLPGEDINQVKESFKEYILSAAAQDPWLKDYPPTIEWFGLYLEPGLTPPDSPIVTKLVQACRDTLAEEPAIIGGGGSDLRLPVLYADSPSVLFGPGGGRIHSVDEYVEVEEVMKVAQVMGRLILAWSGVR